jgi:hypothetical protein
MMWPSSAISKTAPKRTPGYFGEKLMDTLQACP